MDDSAFDKALVGAVFSAAAVDGWKSVSVARAAREAGLDLGRARYRFPTRGAVLWRFGLIADQAALEGAAPTGSVRDRLFDILMRRIDVLQAHRAGLTSLFRVLPAHPGLALYLLRATRRSMAWMLQGAGVGTEGVRGAIRVRGLTALWLNVVRAWERDESPDLSATMRALDDALARAERAVSWLRDRGIAEAAPPGTEEAAPPPPPEPAAAPPKLPDLPAAPYDAPPEPPPGP